jgi:hypothetical protein
LLFDPAGFALATLAAADFAALLLDAVALAPRLFAAAGLERLFGSNRHVWQARLRRS